MFRRSWKQGGWRSFEKLLESKQQLWETAVRTPPQSVSLLVADANVFQPPTTLATMPRGPQDQPAPNTLPGADFPPPSKQIRIGHKLRQFYDLEIGSFGIQTRLTPTQQKPNERLTTGATQVL